MNANPEPYDEKRRLAAIIGDARELLADPRKPYTLADWARRCGALEATLKMLADSAEVFTPYQAPGTGSAR